MAAILLILNIKQKQKEQPQQLNQSRTPVSASSHIILILNWTPFFAPPKSVISNENYLTWTNQNFIIPIAYYLKNRVLNKLKDGLI